MTKTISGSYNSTYTLTEQYTTVLSTGTVSVLLVTAIYGPSGGPSWTVTNSGTLLSTGGYGFGVELLGSGANVTNNAGGIVNGGSAGIYLQGGNGTVVNHGAIRGVQNLKGVLLGFGGTVTNTGTSADISAYKDGVYLNAGGVVTNGAGATISGGDYGVYARQGSALVSNGGTITGSDQSGVELTKGGSVTNQSGGLIQGLRFGVRFTTEGTLVNDGSITAAVIGVDAKTVTNLGSGVISAHEGVSAVRLYNAGAITASGTTGPHFGVVVIETLANEEGALISAAATGVYAARGASITNKGTIIGGTDAVKFKTGANNLLVDAPGAVFTGIVDGGNTVGSSFVSTLQLASGSSAGVFSGLGSEFIDFQQTTIDPGAIWVFSGTNTVVADATLTNSGSIAGNFAPAVTLVNCASLSNAATGLIQTSANAASSSNRTAGAAVLMAGTSASMLTNAATISGSTTTSGTIKATGTFGTGVLIEAGGSVSNQGSIIANGLNAYAIDVNGGSGSVTNSGYIYGQVGVYLQAGGTVTNTNSGTIDGTFYGVEAITDPATVVNSGTIFAGVSLKSGGSVTNQTGGRILSTSFGVKIGGGTLVNAGIIAGPVAAVRFGTVGSNLLIDDAGAVFTGSVDGGNTIGGAFASTLELASGASAGTLDGLGSNYINFEQATIDAGATWSFSGPNTLVSGGTLTDSGTLDAGSLLNNGVILLDPSTMAASALRGTGSVTIGSGSTLTLSGTVASGETLGMTGTDDVLNIGGKTAFSGIVTGFGSTGIIDVQGIGLAKSVAGNGNTLTLYANVNQTGSLFAFPHITGAGGAALNPANIKLVDDGNGGTVVACYLRGTCIRTDRGEVPVEFLCAGDLVATLTGGFAPIRWIGRRRYVLAQTEGQDAIRPVLVRAGAIAHGVPRRDLRVSPEHALYLDGVLVPARHLDGVLVPARHLANDVSIVRCNDPEVLEYFHIELAAHAAIFAEGLPAETFADCDSRNMFDNAHTYTGGGSPPWTFCAPRVEEGELLEAIRQRVNARAGMTCDAAPGPLIGNLERATEEYVEGWAQDAATPERPVWLEIVADGATTAFVFANRHRDDLEAAGIGSGRHAFRARLALQPRCVEARRVEDGALLGVLAPSLNAALSPVSR